MTEVADPPTAVVIISDQEGLERAPRATRDIWAEGLREEYRKHTEVADPDWPDLIASTEDRVFAAAGAGSHWITLDHLKHSVLDELVVRLNKAHPSLTFAWERQSPLRTNILAWK